MTTLRLRTILSAAALAFCAGGAGSADAQQVADSAFSPPVPSPAYAPGAGPVVLIDEAHHNFHTSTGRFLAFARLLERDGYVVRPNAARFSAESLAGASILVISNALARETADEWSMPIPSAFDSAEIAAVREWVREGGSLWLIADHMPFPGAAGRLAAEFGILMTNGFAMDEAKQDGRMVFRRSDELLHDHPIVRGRNGSERVDSVVSFTGQGFRLESGGDALMTLPRNTTILLPDVAWQFSRLTHRISGSGMLQGAALLHGRGRVAVFGEAAMFSAQVSGPARHPMGMNDPSAPRNAQFLLNTAHWLDGTLR